MAFEPTPQTSLDLERALFDLKTKKDGIVNKKIEMQNESATLRLKRKPLNPEMDEHKKISLERSVLKRKLTDIEIEIGEVSMSISNKRMLLTEVNNYLKSSSNPFDAKVKVRISALRDKYGAFSSDHTRINSMRLMASTFCEELESIINK